MKARMHNPGTGWISVSIAFNDREIEELIGKLRALKSGELGHFHFRREEFEDGQGIADVELSMMGSTEVDDMILE